MSKTIRQTKKILFYVFAAAVSTFLVYGLIWLVNNYLTSSDFKIDTISTSIIVFIGVLVGFLFSDIFSSRKKEP